MKEDTVVRYSMMQLGVRSRQITSLVIQRSWYKQTCVLDRGTLIEKNGTSVVAGHVDDMVQLGCTYKRNHTENGEFGGASRRWSE